MVLLSGCLWLEIGKGIMFFTDFYAAPDGALNSLNRISTNMALLWSFGSPSFGRMVQGLFNEVRRPAEIAIENERNWPCQSSLLTQMRFKSYCCLLITSILQLSTIKGIKH
jgi:hypothetical protein